MAKKTWLAILFIKCFPIVEFKWQLHMGDLLYCWIPAVIQRSKTAGMQIYISCGHEGPITNHHNDSSSTQGVSGGTRVKHWHRYLKKQPCSSNALSLPTRHKLMLSQEPHSPYFYTFLLIFWLTTTLLYHWWASP